MKNATCLIGCSEEACSLFHENKHDKIIYNSYDSEKFVWDETDTFVPHPLKLIQVGRYARDKNQIFSLKIFT